MKFGNLNEVFDGEKSIFEVAQDNAPEFRAPSTISKFLSKLSNYGMSVTDDIYRNMHAIPANKDLIPKELDVINNIYGNIQSNFRSKSEEDKPYSEKQLDQKREVLRKMAQQPEIEDILDIMSNECVVYDSEMSYICQPYIDTAVSQMLGEKNIEQLNNAIDTHFYKLYLLLDWKRMAWNDFKRYLVDGVLAYEIVYDDIENPRTILGIVELDPVTLTKAYENGQIVWYQFKGVQNMERRLLDSQIIYIKYEDESVVDRTSYLERLIRPFNIYRIIEQAQVIWTVTQSSFKTMFTIPVNGMNKAKGAQTLNMAMNRYKEDISFNAETGELQINGRKNLPFNKEYWLPENEAGKPEIETLVDQGPQLNDSEQLKHFLSKLYKMSKIPENRFDKEAQSTWFGNDPTQQLRDEINFSRFVERLRNTFAEILLKPLRIQVALSIPDIKNDKRILDAISLRFNSYNQFEEMMGIEIDNKRIEFIQNMAGLVTTDAEGNETPFFCMPFLIKKYLKMSDADMELNEKMKFEEKIASGAAENDETEDTGDEEGGAGDDLLNEPAGGEGGSEPEEGGESDTNEEPDKEMMGDVTPEAGGDR